ncbi:transcriptional regulator, IclR family [Halogranum amylolyticum]|uniref:Transcriptional regulator, IclR family n=1 Tax=Halogranum amylolyticum TaxID=660520 RepID=A0A1H8WQJ8_9EURY|nr:IclR family transcriptional regulator [Halogranum amylolyticum]SEP29994.1 transcriptional regulator, IclR family [Halogranum amylolyticum]
MTTPASRLTTVDRLFDVVEFLQSNGSTGVTELAEELELTKSSAHAYLSALKTRGYAIQDNQSRYHLSLQFLDVGSSVQRGQKVFEAAHDALHHIAEQTGEKAWLVVEEGDQSVFLASVQGENAILIDTQVGQRTELYEIAGGKAILANLPESRRTELLSQYEYPLYPDSVGLTRSELESELQKVRETGIAYNDQFYINAVKGIGAPIIDTNDEVRGALSISGPYNRLEQLGEEQIIELLISTTSEVGVNINYL